MPSRKRLKEVRHLDTRCRPFGMRHFPDFFIAGPQRTGSSWLRWNLRYHPNLRLADEKEIHFFNSLAKRDSPKFRSDRLEWYLAHFRDSPRVFLRRMRTMWHRYREPYFPLARGEATASYANLPEEIIRDITLLNPSLKVIFILRHPVERAWSHAKKTLGRPADGIDKVPEFKVLRYFEYEFQLACADYAGIVARWRPQLRPGHLFLALYEDLENQPLDLMMNLYRFLGVPAKPKYMSHESSSKRRNPTQPLPLPDLYRARLEQVLERRIAEYEALRERIRKQGPTIC